jgi:large subunit ribosomal protein L31
VKKGIHPEWHEARVTCVCGNTWTTHSTRKELRVELCSNCHPFYTGNMRIVDTGGQVERFMRRMRQRQQPATAASGETG